MQLPAVPQLLRGHAGGTAERLSGPSARGGRRRIRRQGLQSGIALQRHNRDASNSTRAPASRISDARDPGVERQRGRIAVAPDGTPETRRRSISSPGAALKRATDLVLATITLVCLSPLLAVVAIAIKLDSPGPVFFRQRRVGRGGSEFTMVKFRSMSADATHEAHHRYVAALAAGPVDPTNGDLLKLTDDPRVTRVGAKIRKASIDELPQLFNVLGGQMSIVGPRPAVHYELDLYRPEHLARFDVRPGITGLWQVSGRNRLGFNEMLDLDVEYAHRHGFGLDLWIIIRTPLAVLRAHTA